MGERGRNAALKENASYATKATSTPITPPVTYLPPMENKFISKPNNINLKNKNRGNLCG